MTDEERRKEKQKLYWFSATTQQDGQRRKPENMAPCAFGMLDIDGSTRCNHSTCTGVPAILNAGVPDGQLYGG